MQPNETANTRKRGFLLSFFKEIPGDYAELEVNGYWLVKHKNGNTNDYEVAIYTKDSYQAMKRYQERNSLFASQDNHLQELTSL